MSFNAEQAKAEYTEEFGTAGTPETWAVSRWPTGGVVINMETFARLPSKQRLKILGNIGEFNKGV